MNYFAKIIANDQEGLQMISACSSAATVKISDIKYLASNKVFLLSIERIKVENKNEDKKTLENRNVTNNKYIDKIESVKNDKIKRSLMELTKVYKEK